jgi:hypothetical protein
MESLTIDIDTPAVTTTVGADGGTIVPATMLQDVLTTIRESDPADAWTKIKDKFPKFAEKHVLIGGRDELSVAALPLNSVKDGTEIKKPKAKNKFVYVSLRSFCELVNTVIIVDNNDKNVIKLNTNIVPLGGDSTSTPTCRFRTYKFHTSSDPGVCVLMTEGSKNWSYEEDFVGKIFANRIGSSDEILNIYLNINLLEGAMAGLLAKEKGERTLLNLFTPIFQELNDVLGGINDIGFQYEESEFTYYIVDRKVQVETKDVSTLNITGLKSTVSQFNFVTKLSPAITTMCAISAQNGASDVGLEAGALLRWNEGIEDRIITKKSMRTGESATPASGSTSPEEERAEQQTTRRKTVNDALNQVYNSRQYDKEAIAAARTQYTQYSTNYIQFYAEDTANVGNAGPAGIIPFQVGIEMDGISGLKIGQAFKINPGIMPSKYDGVVGFIVTGLDHSITGNRWVTNIKAQTIVLKGTTEKRSGPTYSDDFSSTGVSNTERKGLKSSGKVSNYIKTEYIPALDKAVPNGRKGIKMLITAQTQMEGFFPGAKSYRTKNPGNIGNTDNGGTKKLDSLELGVKLQYNYVEKVALNKDPNYPVGKNKTAPGVNDRDSGQTYPSINFKPYKGTLDQYLQIYSTGARKYDTYVNLVIAYFKRNGHTITKDTTLKEIYDIA